MAVRVVAVRVVAVRFGARLHIGIGRRGRFGSRLPGSRGSVVVMRRAVLCDTRVNDARVRDQGRRRIIVGRGGGGLELDRTQVVRFVWLRLVVGGVRVVRAVIAVTVIAVTVLIVTVIAEMMITVRVACMIGAGVIMFGMVAGGQRLGGRRRAR